ncbi:Nucleotidyltransferase [Polyporus arcularius HHB13444]|uniref:DNA polymerase n=1 Tax=Polyporus arcularius HHB13444 TaxID=1314778 RepID=A0A5C3PCT5_9APHY|nr:Nucleotidyltransferase [Polyporus arcularius HHB13444]
MPFKRPAPIPHQGSESGESSPSRPPPAKQQKSSMQKALPDITVYIVQAKLDVGAIAELFELAERHTKGACRNAMDADVIITAIGMRRRLERHVPWDIAETKAVVTPAWLRDSVDHGRALPCGDYVAIQDLLETTVEHCPDCNCKPCACSDGDSEAATPRFEAKQLPSPLSSPSISVKQRAMSTSTKKEEKKPVLPKPVPEHLLPPDPPIPTNLAKLDYMSRYACQRASPLVCPNQALVRELDIIRRSRDLEGEARSALSYERAVSIIKAYPHEIRSLKQVEKLPFIGVKITGLIEEFLDTGKITEAQTINASERFQTLSLFSSIYGIGPSTAIRLYNLGLRSLNDLEVYYGVEPEDVALQSQIVEVEEKPRKPAWQRGQHKGDEGLGDSWTRVALGLREDLAKKISRAEVEEMGRVVMRELEELEPGCVSTIVGGYRRGKAESNDVDIVFTHPDPSKVKGLCKRLVRKLHERGMVTHVMHLSNFHAHNALRTHHWDSLEKALTVFIMPPSSPFHTGVRRRLDLIFAVPDVYWTAVIGWTGSIMFQRDIRQWAKDKHGMKFDSSGITRRYDSKEFFPKTEKEVFDLLGLEWVEPKWRNADL